MKNICNRKYDIYRLNITILFSLIKVLFWQILTVFGLDGKRADNDGGMAEWLKAAVLKTVVRKYRGFESYFLRHLFWRGDREADGARLLSECGG